jgi:hypothetical protein
LNPGPAIFQDTMYLGVLPETAIIPLDCSEVSICRNEREEGDVDEPKRPVIDGEKLDWMGYVVYGKR